MSRGGYYRQNGTAELGGPESDSSHKAQAIYGVILLGSVGGSASTFPLGLTHFGWSCIRYPLFLLGTCM